MPNPYTVLGIDKSASDDEMKSAYRKLAKKLHPDVNPGNKKVEQQFKEITAAYNFLSDPERRKRFDRGEIDDSGQERGFARGGGAGGARQYHYRTDPNSGESWNYTQGGADPFSQFGEDLFAEFFNARRTGGSGAGGPDPRAQRSYKPHDIHYTITIPFIEACTGTRRRLTLSTGRTVDVNIPPGTEDGNKLRLRGLGTEGSGDAGDAIVDIQVTPHPFFVREGDDLRLEAPISLSEAVLGGSINIPTLTGQISVKVPPHTNTDTVLRIKNKGVPHTHTPGAGDLLIKLKIMLPDKKDHSLADTIEKWAKKNPHNPRQKLGREWG